MSAEPVSICSFIYKVEQRNSIVSHSWSVGSSSGAVDDGPLIKLKMYHHQKLRSTFEVLSQQFQVFE